MVTQTFVELHFHINAIVTSLHQMVTQTFVELHFNINAIVTSLFHNDIIIKEILTSTQAMLLLVPDISVLT